MYLFLTALGLCCCVQAFSSCGKWGLLFLAVHGLLTAVASLVAEHGLQSAGFSSCGTWAQQLWLAGSRAQAQQLWCTGLAAPWHVGSSRTRARTRVPCIGRQILNHCATREVPARLFLSGCTILHSHRFVSENYIFHILTGLQYCHYFFLTVLLVVMLNIFLCAYLPSVYPLQ